MGNKMESSIIVSDPIKGVFKVDQRIYLTPTVFMTIVAIYIDTLTIVIKILFPC